MIDRKKLYILISLCLCFATAMLMLTGCGESSDAGTQGRARMGGKNIDDKNLSYAEIGEKLSELGIDGVTDDVIARLENTDENIPNEMLYSKTAGLLRELGIGSYDTTGGAWSPSDNGVYSFDEDFSNYKKMYTMFLAGLSSLGDGELDFVSVSEDLSMVNWESGTGTRSVSFSWRDKIYTVETDYTGDRISYTTINQINEIIKSEDTGKCLYFGSDGKQNFFVFYREAQWKERFEAETGIKLSERISD